VPKKPQANTSAWGYNEEAPKEIGGNKVMLANNKARPQTAAVKTEKTVDIRKQQELEKKLAQEKKIREANMELQNAKMALVAFDSKPTKTKKQVK